MHPNTDRIPVAEVHYSILTSYYNNISILVLIIKTVCLLLKATLQDYQLVFDSVYTPRKTRLLKEAEAAGAIIVSGVEMFLRQAIGQFNLFTGREGTSSEARLCVCGHNFLGSNFCDELLDLATATCELACKNYLENFSN